MPLNIPTTIVSSAPENFEYEDDDDDKEDEGENDDEDISADLPETTTKSGDQTESLFCEPEEATIEEEEAEDSEEVPYKPIRVDIPKKPMDYTKINISKRYLKNHTKVNMQFEITLYNCLKLFLLHRT